MHLSPEQLFASVDGELSGLRGRIAARHLETCALCQAEARRIQDDLASFDAVAARTDPATADALNGGLQAVVHAIRRWKRGGGPAAQLEVYFGSRVAPESGARDLFAVFLGSNAGARLADTIRRECEAGAEAAS